jgi:YrbI family 3-deoxy-D-manno-octulosonate 8-phosphate phosphatase
MWRRASSSPFLEPLLEVPGMPEPFNAPRQSLPEVWWQTGSIDVVRTSVLLQGSMTGPRILPFEVDARYAIDIDTEVSLGLAELRMQDLHCIRPASRLDWDAVRLLVLDVDGSLTPGTMYYSADGEELKRFHTHDGKGLELLRQRTDVKVIVITQESSPITRARCAKLGIENVHGGVHDKASFLERLSQELGISLRQTVYLGDDVGDIEAMRLVREAGGIASAVADARREVRAIANHVTERPGGYGAARDICDCILGSRQRWTNTES